MNDAVRERLAALRAQMAAAVTVVEDYGHSIVVRVVPDADEDQLPEFYLRIDPTLSYATRTVH